MPELKHQQEFCYICGCIITANSAHMCSTCKAYLNLKRNAERRKKEINSRYKEYYKGGV